MFDLDIGVWDKFYNIFVGMGMVEYIGYKGHSSIFQSFELVDGFD